MTEVNILCDVDGAKRRKLIANVAFYLDIFLIIVFIVLAIKNIGPKGLTITGAVLCSLIIIPLYVWTGIASLNLTTSADLASTDACQ